MTLSRTLANTARAMLEAPNSDRAAADLRKRIPPLYQHVRLTSETPSALNLWGRSLNHDEHADCTIVDPIILKVLSDLSGVPLEGDRLHAGMLHTYGYLFSLIETPFGYKRDRWTNGELDAAFGFSAPVLSALPSRGTLLLNATYFLGRIAFRGCRRELDRLRRILPRTAPGAAKFDYRRLQVARLEETVFVPRDKKVQISLVTDFVRYPVQQKRTRNGSSNSALLVYSVTDNRKPIRNLMTAFPISLDTIRSLTDPAALGDCQPVKVTYNASVESLDHTTLSGSRRLSGNWWRDDEP